MIMMVIIVNIVIIVASTNTFFFNGNSIDFDVILSFLTSPKIAVAESDCDHFDRHN